MSLMMVLSLVVLALAVALLLWARRKLKAATNLWRAAYAEEQNSRERQEIATADRKEAEHERELAGALMVNVQKIEDSLTRPRFALNLVTGRIRALRHNEEPNLAEEVNTGDPNPDCKKCYGRGWDGRRRETGRVVPCVCVKRVS